MSDVLYEGCVLDVRVDVGYTAGCKDTRKKVTDAHPRPQLTQHSY